MKFQISNVQYPMSNLVVLVLVLVVGLTLAPRVFAHVVVKPSQVGVGAFQTFTIGVPTEKELPTVGMRLVIPDGLQFVSPNVKPGWTINVKKTGEGETAKVTEITWTGGAIPSGQRDDFLFSAKVPPAAGYINWKAYQTYQDGTVVSWDQDPNTPKPSPTSGDDEGGVTPFSTTKVVDDLSATPQPVVTAEGQKDSNTPLIFSITALALSAAAIGLALRKK